MILQNVFKQEGKKHVAFMCHISNSNSKNSNKEVRRLDIKKSHGIQNFTIIIILF